VAVVTNKPPIDIDPGKNTVTYIPLVQQALTALQSLNPVERAVLGLRFGLDDGLEHNLEEVAQHYGVPVEIIKCVEIDALRKLRHHDCYQQKTNSRATRSKGKKSKNHLYIVD